MSNPSRRPNRNKINLLIDLAIFMAFLLATAPHFTGIAIHEWLSIAFGAAIVTHLLLHWQWLAEVTRRFFGKAQWSARINYLLNSLLFIAFTVIIFSGLMISEAVLPLFGIEAQRGFSWRALHSLASDAAVLLVGLHVALHWRWIVSAVKRFLIAPLRPRRPAQAASLTHTQQEV